MLNRCDFSYGNRFLSDEEKRASPLLHTVVPSSCALILPETNKERVDQSCGKKGEGFLFFLLSFHEYRLHKSKEEKEREREITFSFLEGKEEKEERKKGRREGVKQNQLGESTNEWRKFGGEEEEEKPLVKTRHETEEKEGKGRHDSFSLSSPKLILQRLPSQVGHFVNAAERERGRKKKLFAQLISLSLPYFLLPLSFHAKFGNWYAVLEGAEVKLCQRGREGGTERREKSYS